MKSLKLILVSLVGVSAVLYAGQRVRVIDRDTAATPKVSQAINVPLTPAALSTNTFNGTTVVLSNRVATAATITLYTMVLTNAHADVTNVVTVVTNATITALSVATNVVVGASVTNATGVATGAYGFTQAQANGILTNVNLLYQLLQP